MATAHEIANDLRAQIALMNTRGFREDAMKRSLARAATRLEELAGENLSLRNEIDRPALERCEQ